MSYLVTHFFEGGTQEGYETLAAKVHPADGSLPAGQTHHFAGPTEGGFLVAAVWDSKESNDTFQETLRETLGAVQDGPPPPQARSAEVTNEAHS